MTQPQHLPPAPTFDELVAAFERGMQAADDYEFGQLVSAFDWETASADQWLKGTNMAISMGFLPLVRRLASEGMKRWPDEPGFAQAWEVVRPATVAVGASVPRSERMQRAQEWVSQHGHEYAGNWLAIKDGRLLAAAPSIEEVRKLAGSDWGFGVCVIPVFP